MRNSSYAYPDELWHGERPGYSIPSKTNIEMCKFYTWDKKPICNKGYHRASIKCHIERLECPGYRPSKEAK